MNESTAAATAPKQETAWEKAKRFKKQLAKKTMSVPIKIMESDLYDWNPTARSVLICIAYSQRTNEDAYFPEDCPYEKDDMLGWCDMSQWRIALRVGISQSQVSKYINRFEEDQVLDVRRWEDSNKAKHDMYRIVESTVDAHQRPEQSETVERPPRSNRDYKAYENRGAFKKGKDDRRANMEEKL